MEKVFVNEKRSRAWADVKSAVRDYARDPSDGNAQKVEACWKAIRRCDGFPVMARQNSLIQIAARFPKVFPGTAKPRPNSGAAPDNWHIGVAHHVWPVNEIVMRSLLDKGMSNVEIATMYHVSPESVSVRRKVLGL